MTRGRRILIIDDEVSICDVLSIALKKDGYDVHAETNPKHALERLKNEPFDVVIEDLKMPEMDGIELLRRIKEIDEATTVIVITAYSTWDRAVEAMRLGAYDYIRKPFDTNIDVRATIARALQVKETKYEMAHSFDETLQKIGLVVGYSKSMKSVRDLIRRAAPTDSTILIYGESGVGKELVSRSVHYTSPRAPRPFISVNCAALTESLLESELFGHAKGAFTGAISDKVGLIEVANTGTLFLDEVSEMSPALQVKLLRVLEEKEFKPVGNVQTRRVDVRFITATNRNLEDMTQEGGFRKDLFYRLNVIPIRIPPLRERREDIPILAEFFLQKYSREMTKPGCVLSPPARDALLEYPWPGNIRELENAIQRAIALSEQKEISATDLFESIRRPADLTTSQKGVALSEDGLNLEKTLEDIEIGYLKKALEIARGNYTKAAQLVRLSLRSFRYKIQKHGLDKNPGA